MLCIHTRKMIIKVVVKIVHVICVSRVCRVRDFPPATTSWVVVLFCFVSQQSTDRESIRLALSLTTHSFGCEHTLILITQSESVHRIRFIQSRVRQCSKCSLRKALEQRTLSWTLGYRHVCASLLFLCCIFIIPPSCLLSFSTVGFNNSVEVVMTSAQSPSYGSD